MDNNLVAGVDSGPGLLKCVHVAHLPSNMHTQDCWLVPCCYPLAQYPSPSRLDFKHYPVGKRTHYRF